MGAQNDRMGSTELLEPDRRFVFGADGDEEKRNREAVYGRQGSESEGKEPSATDWILDVHAQLEARNRYVLDEDKRRAPTGFWALDAATGGGIRPGEVFGLMARSGTGKTVAMCNILRQWGERCSDRTQVCFSLEMPSAQIILRNTQIVYGMNKEEAAEAIEHGAIDDTEYLRVFGNLILVDRVLSVEKMGEVLAKAHRITGKKVGMFAIDYLGMIGGGGSVGRYERVSQNAIDVKGLAKTHDAAALLLIQVNRDKGGDGTKPLTLGSARDSGVIEEAVDYMAGLWRKTLDGADLGMALLKNRHGELVRGFTVYFNKHDITLTDKA